MILDKLCNLSLYGVQFSSIKNLIDLCGVDDIVKIDKNTELHDFKIIPIQGEPNLDFERNILEAHIKNFDIHITIAGSDIIAFSNIDDECYLHKDYDVDNDYALYKSTQIKTLIIPEGYFCIIPNHLAHMAMYGISNSVKKIVIKIPAS